jgi:hypothetical protein
MTGTFWPANDADVSKLVVMISPFRSGLGGASLQAHVQVIASTAISADARWESVGMNRVRFRR